MKIIIIVGLPGSGKTHLAHKIAQENHYFIADDWKLCDIHKLPECDMIITNPNLCQESYFDKYISELTQRFDPEFEYIYFENDPQTCQHNAVSREILLRGHSNCIEKSISRLSPDYKPPKNKIPVYHGI